MPTAEICCAPVAKILHITPDNNRSEFTHVVHFLFITVRLKSLYCCFLEMVRIDFLKCIILCIILIYSETLLWLQSCCTKCRN